MHKGKRATAAVLMMPADGAAISQSAPSGARRSLSLEDLNGLVQALGATHQPSPIYQAIERLSGEVIGHRLFTIARANLNGSEIERVHSSLPAIYPVGGRKQKAGTPWANRVLREMKIFRAVSREEIRATFDDHQSMLNLGLGSILNIPIVFDGRCVGTMNLCHDPGWYCEKDEVVGRLLSTFLVPALATAHAPST